MDSEDFLIFLVDGFREIGESRIVQQKSLGSLEFRIARATMRASALQARSCVHVRRFGLFTVSPGYFAFCCESAADFLAQAIRLRNKSRNL